MRTIERTGSFRHDYKREMKSGQALSSRAKLIEVLELLSADAMLPESLKDHKLTGQWSGYRDCHIRPDVVLVYRKIGSDRLELARLGSHSELGF